MSRLKDLYNNEIVDAMTKKFGYANEMCIRDRISPVDTGISGRRKGFCQNTPRQHLRASWGMAFLVIKNYWAVLYELSDKNMIHLLLNSLDKRRNSQKYSGKPVQNGKKELF